jgi:phosphoglycerate dehydrogenase-like enzyme
MKSQKKKPKLLYYDMLNFQQANLDLIETVFDLVTVSTPDQDDQVELSGIDACFAPLGYFFNQEKMRKMPKLKVICSNTTSVPHIDERQAKLNNLKVVSLQYEIEFLKTITPTAEHTWGLLLALTRYIPKSFQSVLDGKWSRWPFGARSMMSRMSLGIVGYGRVGSIVANYGVAFGMKVLVFDPYKTVGDLLNIKQVDSLELLVSEVDVVSLHMHLTKETEGLINKELFLKFKHGSYLINTARGAIVDSNSLVEALLSEKISGAATDVLDDEFEQGADFSVIEHPLVDYATTHDNLIITPHIAGSTQDAWFETQRFTIQRMIEWFEQNDK